MRADVKKYSKMFFVCLFFKYKLKTVTTCKCLVHCYNTRHFMAEEGIQRGREREKELNDMRRWEFVKLTFWKQLMHERLYSDLEKTFGAQQNRH